MSDLIAALAYFRSQEVLELRAENERLREALELEEMSLAVCNDKACELLAKNERLREALRYTRQICVKHDLLQTLEVIDAALEE